MTNIEQKTLVKYINIGSPINKELYGDVPVLQLNDAIASVDDVQIWVSQKRGELAENEQSKMIVSMKVDREVKMGIVTDVKQELRKANALKILYATGKGERTK